MVVNSMYQPDFLMSPVCDSNLHFPLARLQCLYVSEGFTAASTKPQARPDCKYLMAGVCA